MWPAPMIEARLVARAYDDEHGGTARAGEAAAALDELLDEHLGPRRLVLDLAAGPAAVGRLLTGTVVALDRSPDFTAAAATVLPGRTVRADAGAGLPVRTGALDAVVSVWWLHTTAKPGAVVAEVARVLRPGGSFATTTDKLAVDEHARGAPSAKPWRGDATAPLVAICHAAGLDLVGARSFLGHGHPEPDSEAVYPVLAFRRGPS